LFEIQSGPDEIFVNGATVDDIVIVSAITASEVRAPIESVVSDTSLTTNRSIIGSQAVALGTNDL
jgi:hypothetical protein